MSKPTKKDRIHFDTLQDVLAYFQEKHSDMEENFNDKSETWQESEAGQKMQVKISFPEDAILGLEDAIENLQNAYNFT